MQHGWRQGKKLSMKGIAEIYQAIPTAHCMPEPAPFVAGTHLPAGHPCRTANALFPKMGYDCLRTPPTTRCRTSKQLELGRDDSICIKHFFALQER
jgi:hypothetical protein